MILMKYPTCSFSSLKEVYPELSVYGFAAVHLQLKKKAIWGMCSLVMQEETLSIKIAT